MARRRGIARERRGAAVNRALIATSLVACSIPADDGVPTCSMEVEVHRHRYASVVVHLDVTGCDGTRFVLLTVGDDHGSWLGTTVPGLCDETVGIVLGPPDPDQVIFGAVWARARILSEDDRSIVPAGSPECSTVEHHADGTVR